MSDGTYIGVTDDVESHSRRRIPMCCRIISLVFSVVLGSVLLHERSSAVTPPLGRNFREVKKLTAPGYLQWVDVDGDVCLFTGRSTDTYETNTGAAYVFARDWGGPNNWGQMAELVASDGVPSDEFGFHSAVAGSLCIIGAPSVDIEGQVNQGAAYVFARDRGGPDTWGQVKKLTAPDGVGVYHFGGSVAVSGSLCVVGARYAEIDTNANQGAAYVFARNAGGADNWGFVKRLIAPDGAAQDQLGFRVAVSGSLCVAGASSADIDEKLNQGAAYIFAQNAGGANNWGCVKKLVTSDGEEFDQFGRFVAMSGSTCAVTAYSADIGGISDLGAVYIFSRDSGGANQWGQVRKIDSGLGEAGGRLGNIAISDGVCLAGSYKATITGSIYQGATCVYLQNAGGTDGWGKVKTLVASDGVARDNFGGAVAISGNVLAISAGGVEVGPSAQGAAYIVYMETGPVWAARRDTSIAEGMSLSFMVSADSPNGHTLTYWAPTLPFGAGFDSGTQMFTWTPTYDQAGDALVVFRVTDGYIPVMDTVLIHVIDDPTGISEIPLPVEFALSQNTPNPLNPSTTIRFELPTTGAAHLAIYSTSGQLVRTLVDSNIESGTHQVVWDGRDAIGRDVSSGVYAYRLRSAAATLVRKMLLVR
jgi:hypothetical protein